MITDKDPISTRSSSKAFFADLIDYAGLFPPAALSLADSLSNYDVYRSSQESWILGRLILSVAHLEGLARAPLLTSRQPLPLSVVTRDPVDDIGKAIPIIQALGKRVQVKSIEVTINSNSLVSDYFATLESTITSLDDGYNRISLFLEIPDCPTWEDLLIPVLSSASEISKKSGRVVGFKLRCGGAPQMIPSPQRIARTLLQCATCNLPIKFTAGLHQPFRKSPPDEPGTTEHHGFFNLFFAALLAYRGSISEGQLERVIGETSSLTPAFTDSSISWLEHSLTMPEIARIRQTRATSFGSCSFLEPVDEAKLLGWI